jgi:hypothetical protein
MARQADFATFLGAISIDSATDSTFKRIEV